jgi:release factor glutamine methyltransferase
MPTIQDVLAQGVQRLTKSGRESARLEAQVLLSHVLGLERPLLYAYPEREVTAEQAEHYLSLIERRMQGEPVAYLTGHKEFYGLDFFVDKRVLIPRPETELLVEAALAAGRKLLAREYVPIIADIGTGSGAIPVTLAVQEPRLPYLYATDISADALTVARLNAERYHVEPRIRFLQGDLLAPLPEAVDIITANLPYIGTGEMSGLAPDVRAYEPHLALFSGPNGLDLLNRFFAEVQRPGVLKEHAVLLLEIGYRQREALTRIARAIWPYASITFQKDYTGWDRLLQITL